MQEFSYISVPISSNHLPFVNYGASIPYNKVVEGATDLHCEVALEEPFNVVYLHRTCPIIVDSSKLDATHKVQVKYHGLFIGNEHYHMTVVTVEEKNDPDWMITEFVTPHPNWTVPVFFIGKHLSMKFLRGLLLQPVTQYHKSINERPIGFIHERIFNCLLDPLKPEALAKLLLINARNPVMYDYSAKDPIEKFLMGLSKTHCFGYEGIIELGIREAIDGFRCRAPVNYEVGARFNRILALNILIELDIVHKPHADRISVSPFGEFVIRLFESSKT